MPKEKTQQKNKQKASIDLNALWLKHKIIFLGAGGALLLLCVMFLLSGSDGRQGTILYGICSAFLEQQVTYPETINQTYVEQYPRAVRIYFTQTDAFGQYRLEMMECSFVKNPQNQIIMEKASLNRQDISEGIIQKFNLSIPAIIASEPDLTLPVTVFTPL